MNRKRFAIIIGLFALFFVLACTCPVGQLFSSGINSDFAGTWSETWCVGESSDVTYSDVYDLTISGSALNIVAPDRSNYDFSEITVKGQNLKFILTNTNGSGVSIDYDLNLNSDGTQMEGTADTNEGIHCPILWEKQ